MFNMKPYGVFASYFQNIRYAILTRPCSNRNNKRSFLSRSMQFGITEDGSVPTSSSMNTLLSSLIPMNDRKLANRHISLGLSLSLTQTLDSVNERPLTPSPLSSPPSSPTSQNSPSGHLDKVNNAINRAVKKRGTKASSTSIDNDVNELCQFYTLLNIDEKNEILLLIASTLSSSRSQIVNLVDSMPRIEREATCSSANISNDNEAFIRWEDKLRQSLQPPYHWLATQISRLSGGVKFIIDIREDLLSLLLEQTLSREHQMALKAFDASLRDLLSLWFTVGLLHLQRITWESSCDILQKVSEYEAVHPMRNWTDLKRRVGRYRRCFIFTHSCMPNEPLVVLHTFLTDSISSSMAKIVHTPRNLSFDESSMEAGEDSSAITTAIFYSITSTQKGLKGIELGNYLIKRVVSELQREMPQLTQFSSLSPIPGFVKWLDANMVKAQRGEIQLFASTELQPIQDVLQVCSQPDVYAELRRMLKTNSWAREEDLKILLESPLMRLCAFYLYLEKRRGYALDSVANFHLRNGAVMWRINWNADKSPRGMDNSCGIMVNYRYFLNDCENNSKTYLETYKVTASDHLIYLAKMAQDIINTPPDPMLLAVS